MIRFFVILFSFIVLLFSCKEEDILPPKIELKGEKTVQVEVMGTFEDPGAKAFDNFDGNLTTEIKVISNVDVNIMGTYKIHYSVNDKAGNVGVAYRFVNVVKSKTDSTIESDNTPPVIVLYYSDHIILNKDSAFEDPGAAAYDDVFGDVSFTIEVTGNVDSSQIGTYLLTYTAHDLSNNYASKQREVEVVEDLVPPTIYLSPPFFIQMRVGDEYMEPQPGPTAFDLVWGDVTDRIEMTNNIDNTSPGDYEVRYTVTDYSGNEAVRTRTVRVIY